MHASPQELAQVRLDNALALFEEFVRATARHADAATLRGLERRFAERIQIQPSYWSQIKGRSRQIGERLARQFEMLCNKPAGWMDQVHGPASTMALSHRAEAPVATPLPATQEWMPQDEDERFILGLVMTYYRRHPQRARARLMDLLGEVLTPTGAAAAPPKAPPLRGSPVGEGAATSAPADQDDAQALWRRSQAGVAPLKRKN